MMRTIHMWLKPVVKLCFSRSFQTHWSYFIRACIREIILFIQKMAMCVYCYHVLCQLKHFQCHVQVLIQPTIAATSGLIGQLLGRLWPLSSLFYHCVVTLSTLVTGFITRRFTRRASTMGPLSIKDISQPNIYSSPPGQNGRYFADDIFKWISVNESFVFWLKFQWSLFLRVQLTIAQHWLR